MVEYVSSRTSKNPQPFPLLELSENDVFWFSDIRKLVIVMQMLQSTFNNIMTLFVTNNKKTPVYNKELIRIKT